MRTYTTSEQLRRAVREAKAKGRRIGFAPTMGNLHAGHIQLVREAAALCDEVVVSIFVNPLQFGPGEDFESYPRTLIADKEKLFAEGVPALFAPSVEEVYPGGMARQTQVLVPGLSETLCGADRPGHFRGVATVVAKFFHIVQPDVAVFGEKDYQQLSIIRKMVRDLRMPIDIVGVPTVRAEDGLALSSRNSFLSPAERRAAPLLNQTLQECREAVACGFDNFRELEAHAQLKLIRAGFEPEYVEIRDAGTLREVTASTEEIAILAAAKLGKPRLIDNVRLSLDPAGDWGMLAADSRFDDAVHAESRTQSAASRSSPRRSPQAAAQRPSPQAPKPSTGGA